MNSVFSCAKCIITIGNPYNTYNYRMIVKTRNTFFTSGLAQLCLEIGFSCVSVHNLSFSVQTMISKCEMSVSD